MTRISERLRRSRTAGSGGFDRRLIAPMILGSVLNPINSSMLAVALIPISVFFHVSPSQTAWLVSGLYLATAVGQPVIGRLVDSYGPRTLYLAGTALVGIAGLMGVLAPSLGVLIASRVLLGFGTSAAYPASMYLLRTESARTGMKSPSGILAALSISNQVIAVIGPTLGGLLIAAGGWHLIFGINVPLSAACLVLGARRLARAAALTSGPQPAQRVDVPGMLLFAGMLTVFVLFLMAPSLAHWYLLVISAAAGVLFTFRELRTDQPFIDLSVLRGNAPLLATYGRQLLAYTTAYALLYGYSQWLQEGRSLSASDAGLLLLPMSATAIIVTAVTGRHAQVRGKLVAGAVVQLGGCAALLLLDTSTPLWALVLLGAVIGIPQGLNGLANQNALYAQAEPARMGSSAGLLRTFMYLGALLAAAANAAFYQHGATTPGLHDLGRLLLAVAALFLLASVADRSLRRVGRTEADGRGDPAGEQRANCGAEADSHRTPQRPLSPTSHTETDTPMPATTLDPKTALVVIDLQNGVMGFPGTPHPASEVLVRTVQLADAFRAHALPVVLVRVTSAEDGSDATPGRTDTPRRTATPPAGWDIIVDDLTGHTEDIVVTKRNWSAFYGTDLDLHLRRRGVTQIVLAGIATSIGVESTARAAHEHGYHVTLATDAMTDIDAEAHRNSIERIFPRLGETSTTADLLDLLGKTHS